MIVSEDGSVDSSFKFNFIENNSNTLSPLSDSNQKDVRAHVNIVF